MDVRIHKCFIVTSHLYIKRSIIAPVVNVRNYPQVMMPISISSTEAGDLLLNIGLRTAAWAKPEPIRRPPPTLFVIKDRLEGDFAMDVSSVNIIQEYDTVSYRPVGSVFRRPVIEKTVMIGQAGRLYQFGIIPHFIEKLFFFPGH
jgi:hypothetical protein